MDDVQRQFWFFTFPPAPGAGTCQLLAAASTGLSRRTVLHIEAVAVEVFRSPPDCWSILVSIADSRHSPTTLQCLFGVSNDPAWCDRAASIGLPVVEAEIAAAERALSVETSLYGLREGIASTPRPQLLLRLHGLDPDEPLEGPYASNFEPLYRQLLTTPDIARPDTELVGRFVDSHPVRTNVRDSENPGAYVEMNTAVLYPDLFKLLASGEPASRRWAGNALGWRQTQQYTLGAVTTPAMQASPRFGSRYLTRFPRTSVFGPPAFLFEDVEIVGFRTELRLGDEDGIGELITPLNFHLRRAGGSTGHQEVPGEGPEDFRYQPATGTVVIELLRYGKMRALNPASPFLPEDFMSQHELLARVAVGRVDDDTSQARDAAIFVPAIFVDNPWSKALGRRLQGFPKALAEFRADGVPLSMDGSTKTPPHAEVPLHRVTEVYLVGRVGAPPMPTDRILMVQCPDAADGSADQFLNPTVTSILSSTVLRRAPLQQSDFFEQAEFRRSFARELVADGFNGFRSVQVSPVDDVDLPNAWITGRCTLNDVQVAFPTGVATLTLEAPDSAPQAWKDLCRALRHNSPVLGFPTGDWYRVKCSMELAVDDGLGW